MTDVSPCDRFEMNGSVALVHDLAASGLAPEYSDCDAIYTEMAWPAGYDKFVTRSGSAAAGWQDYLDEIIVLSREKRPFVLTCGSLVTRRMSPWAQSEHEITLGGQRARVMAFNTTLGPCATQEDALEQLADRFERIGDPCCGYGLTGRIALLHGKRFVMSDINPKCIGYIAAHASEWER